MTAAQHGGKRPGAGRPKGSRNRTTKACEAVAREHAPRMFEVLAEVANDATEPAAARVAAAKAVLDRAYGRPRQSVEVGGAQDLPALTVEFVGPGAPERP